MLEGKYSQILTVLLVLVIIAIIGLLAYMGYDFYRKYYIEKDAEEFMEQYEQDISQVISQTNTVEENNISTIIDPGQHTTTNNTSSKTSSSGKSYTYKGFLVLGTIEIPKTGIKYPILDSTIPKALENSIIRLHGSDLNEPGNVTFAGHNYKNGSFFGKNKKLVNGDIIYITDNTGRKLKYTIYNIYQTTSNDADYMTRQTNGKREISMTTCTNDSKARLIIWAKE